MPVVTPKDCGRRFPVERYLGHKMPHLHLNCGCPQLLEWSDDDTACTEDDDDSDSDCFYSRRNKKPPQSVSKSGPTDCENQPPRCNEEDRCEPTEHEPQARVLPPRLPSAQADEQSQPKRGHGLILRDITKEIDSEMRGEWLLQNPKFYTYKGYAWVMRRLRRVQKAHPLQGPNLFAVWTEEMTKQLEAAKEKDRPRRMAVKEWVMAELARRERKRKAKALADKTRAERAREDKQNNGSRPLEG